MDFTVTRLDNTTYSIENVLAGVKIISAEQNMNLMADDTVSIKVESPIQCLYEIGDSITVIGRRYKLNQLPKMEKDDEKYVYDLTFEGVHYDLLAASFNLNIDTTTNELQDLLGDSLTGNLSRFLTVLIANANRVFPGKWAAGTSITSTDKTLTFSEEDNCLSVINMLCDEYECEYYITQNAGVNTLYFQKLSGTVSGIFEFGHLKGMYQMSRENVNAENLCTRLFAYGSNEVPNRYRADRLCLPGKNKNNSYVQNQNKIDQYGLYEKKKYFDVQPGRVGTITALGADINSFVDNNMFDLNAKWNYLPADYTEYLAITNQEDTTEVLEHFHDHVVDTYKYRTSESPVVRFTSGHLSGYEVQVQSYDSATRTFKIVPTKEQDIDIPSAEYPAYQFEEGDTYRLSNINLTVEDLQAAESEVEDKANEYYSDFSVPFVQYRINLDELSTLFKNASAEVQNMFIPGYKVYIKDSDYQIDRLIRIQIVKRDLLYPLTYELTTADISYRDKKYRRVRTVDQQATLNNHFSGQLNKTAGNVRTLNTLVPRTDHESIFIDDNPILEDGQICVVKGLNQLKIGDGKTYNDTKFKTNHSVIIVNFDQNLELYNPIDNSTLIITIPDTFTLSSAMLYFDRFRSAARDVEQIDGRVHKAIVKNNASKAVEFESALTSAESGDGSLFIEFGTASIQPGAAINVEWFWVNDGTNNICYTKFYNI